MSDTQTKDTQTKDQKLPLTFRKAEKTDLEGILSFVKEAVKVLEGLGVFQWDEIYPAREDFARDILRGEAFVAEVLDSKTQKRRLAAVFTLNSECDEDYKNGQWKYKGTNFLVVHRLCVNPEFQNQGIGTQVCRSIVEISKNQDKKALRLDAFSKNPFSVKMYQKLGFSITGTADWRKGRFYLMEKILQP